MVKSLSPALLGPSVRSLSYERGQRLKHRAIPDQENLRILISQYLEVAKSEEHLGCFGEAESYLMKAKATAEQYFPNSTLLVIVYLETGLFFCRFLSKSRIPLSYLRSAWESRRLLSAKQAVKTACALAKLLIETEEAEEAKFLIRTLRSEYSGEESQNRSRMYLGKALTRYDLPEAERRLRVAVESARVPGSKALGEGLFFLGEVLLEKECFGECEALFLEALVTLKPTHSSYVPALLALSALYAKANRFEAIDAVFARALESMGSIEARPYRKADLYLAWGDVYTQIYSEAAALHFFEALHICEGVRESSWYVMRVLWKISALSEGQWLYPQWIRSLEAAVKSRISVVLLALPDAFSMLCVGLKSGVSEYRSKLLRLHVVGNEAESAEVMTRLLLDSYFCYEEQRVLEETHLALFPNSRTQPSSVDKAQSDCKGDPLARAAALLDQADPFAQSNIDHLKDTVEAIYSSFQGASVPLFNGYLKLGLLKMKTQHKDEAIFAFIKALSISRLINPYSSYYAKALEMIYSLEQLQSRTLFEFQGFLAELWREAREVTEKRKEINSRFFARKLSTCSREILLEKYAREGTPFEIPKEKLEEMIAFAMNTDFSIPCSARLRKEWATLCIDESTEYDSYRSVVLLRLKQEYATYWKGSKAEALRMDIARSLHRSCPDNKLMLRMFYGASS